MLPELSLATSVLNKYKIVIIKVILQVYFFTIKNRSKKQKLLPVMTSYFSYKALSHLLSHISIVLYTLS